ncbi:hypothetical protein HanRHA438_Chr00c49g0858531 [Helianthus annuus]|uniref:Cotton fiber protein n=1 Tax=Helianthus annuus TaxID=4232 RepID=A0A251TUT2_HELAN|nr:uncharacterized protein LOC110876160 [Helianthus annuus]KAF5813258.1 hypothetical protein HanXRQr2_Chr03g0096131 [Helianthus annuus]KAJ0599442.1 hypothetical protein HanIR_Chr03g0104901 [Helianthus annuus]KAJ0607020.1 hypothetical protein HanHA89_Chr03g0091681 [Helianthus annuus]KAJ0772933.1 hypothetical protein HanOQP8_Chr03g0093081 [Helianthus annuus]KAJ0934416.1 hypothetical protein HanRHA438_Chr03g0107171 [Helianthus annuus]
MAEDHDNRKWHVLSRLKAVVKKVTFLMNSNVNRWRIVSAFTGRVGGCRRLSFGEGLGLTAIMSSSDDDEENNNIGFGDTGSSSSSSFPELNKSKSFRVDRTKSFREEEDIDKRAEMFIDNFYRQLRYQKQVSLELRYARNRSFESSDSSSISFSP